MFQFTIIPPLMTFDVGGEERREADSSPAIHRSRYRVSETGSGSIRG